ncbi:MAG TPA: hypothetical protein VE968_07160 [Sphingomicrobium sp.]|nr:hypothetical protein [Sphingomicrobium sp.]
MVMTNELGKTLEMLGRAARAATDEWWLIGSAAVVLHGGHVPHVNDVDLMMSARDADEFLRRAGAESGGVEPSERFQSAVFGIWNTPSVPVEVFGGFKLARGGTWREVSFSTREPINVGNEIVYVPSAAELVRLLHSFGRMKDLERAKLLSG